MSNEGAGAVIAPALPEKGATDMSELLTLEEAAARVKLKPKTVRGWLQSRKLEGVKVGKQWRIPAESLEAFIRPATAEPFRLREPESVPEQEPATAVD